jgi:hypothetical protein
MTKLTEDIYRRVRTALTNTVGRDPEILLLGLMAANHDENYRLVYGIVSNENDHDYLPFTMRIGRDDLHLWHDRAKADVGFAANAAVKLTMGLVDGDYPDDPHK